MNFGIPLMIAPLNVTHQAQIIKDEIEQLGETTRSGRPFMACSTSLNNTMKTQSGALRVHHYMTRARLSG